MSYMGRQITWVTGLQEPQTALVASLLNVCNLARAVTR
jgi:hypothetical protein